ncbi:MAG: hypothetical protein H0W00_01795 [Chloroflexi bacterium]|nr:hypothetical protein [Chloroflexota bacterium]
MRLGAAAARLEDQVGGGAPRALAPYFFGQRHEEEARGILGEERFEQLRREGRSMEVDAARDLVRATPLPPDGASAIPVESRLR